MRTSRLWPGFQDSHQTSRKEGSYASTYNPRKYSRPL